jgi:nucleoid DNA-binding protein
MTLTKNKMVSEIGRRTRLKNRDVQAMLETLIVVWTEELVSGGRIELENFMVLEMTYIDRGEKTGSLLIAGKLHQAPRIIKKLSVKPSKSLKRQLSRSEL